MMLSNLPMLLGRSLELRMNCATRVCYGRLLQIIKAGFSKCRTELLQLNRRVICASVEGPVGENDSTSNYSNQIACDPPAKLSFSRSR
jgi:hypothetical protein